jgi:hypothetical protein
MCVDIFCMCYFSHVLVRYIDVLLFRQFFDCKIVFKFALIQNLKSLSSVLSQSLYLYVFLSRMAFHTFIFHRKESMEISCYILYFSLKIFDFLTCIIFVIYIQHWHLISCGAVALIVSEDFILCLLISENWPRTIRATVPQLALCENGKCSED